MSREASMWKNHLERARNDDSSTVYIYYQNSLLLSKFISIQSSLVAFLTLFQGQFLDAWGIKLQQASFPLRMKVSQECIESSPYILTAFLQQAVYREGRQSTLGSGAHQSLWPETSQLINRIKSVYYDTGQAMSYQNSQTLGLILTFLVPHGYSQNSPVPRQCPHRSSETPWKKSQTIGSLTEF